MSKIYVIGPVSSGKTTLANTLAKKLNIKMYELDKVVWDDDNGNIKRSNEDIAILFLKIIKENSWIIEDVGRSKFIDGVNLKWHFKFTYKCDIISYERKR